METRKIDRWMDNARGFAAAGTATRKRAGGAPYAAVIAASDFPVDPLALTGAAAGDIYEIRTVAGLVPPSAGEEADRSVGAALEFAVNVCGVGHIIVLAHPDCGLIRCLIDDGAPGAHAVAHGQFLPSWTSIAASALSRVLRANIADDRRALLCSQEIVRVSFENLMTYQWVLDGVFGGTLELHGWYVDTVRGQCLRFDPDSDSFV